MELGPSIGDTGVGERGCTDVGPFVSVHHIGRFSLWHRYMGGDSPNWEGIGVFPSQGGATDCM